MSYLPLVEQNSVGAKGYGDCSRMLIYNKSILRCCMEQLKKMHSDVEYACEHDEKYCYLQVVDGWDSSNSGRYLDFNGYYDVVKAIGFKLNG